ncbi:hypothetical protein GCM10017673_14930 [Streptosporangium violaceochromogenes]|nr:hypothetical protein GCM10017673_14930 [Streptosporangium violaceochromogenes]
MTWTRGLLTALAEHLHAAGVGVWRPVGPPYTSGETAIMLTRLPISPDRAIALAAYGADSDDPTTTDGVQGVQLRVRGTTDPTVVDDIADAAFDALQGWQFPAAGILLATRKLQAPLGTDGSGRWERADSYTLLVHRPTSLRPG